MSHEGNVQWLDSMYEKFNESTDGRHRSYILQRLKEEGFKEDADTLIELWWEQRSEYLAAVGVRGSDVLRDDEGFEFYFDEVENGNPGEDGYAVDTKKIQVPDNLDVEHWGSYTYPYRKEDLKRLNYD